MRSSNTTALRVVPLSRALASRLETAPDLPPTDGPRLRLAPGAREVLEVAWQESVARGRGAPADSADLLIGLLRHPRTQRVLAYVGITEDQVRRVKRGAHGYEIALRFGAVAEQRSTKTQQMGRIAGLATVGARGIRIMEALGVDDLPIRELLAADLPPVNREPLPQEPGLLGVIRRKVRQLRRMAPQRRKAVSWRAAGGLLQDESL